MLDTGAIVEAQVKLGDEVDQKYGRADFGSATEPKSSLVMKSWTC